MYDGFLSSLCFRSGFNSYREYSDLLSRLVSNHSHSASLSSSQKKNAVGRGAGVRNGRRAHHAPRRRAPRPSPPSKSSLLSSQAKQLEDGHPRPSPSLLAVSSATMPLAPRVVCPSVSSTSSVSAAITPAVVGVAVGLGGVHGRQRGHHRNPGPVEVDCRPCHFEVLNGQVRRQCRARSRRTPCARPCRRRAPGRAPRRQGRLSGRFVKRAGWWECGNAWLIPPYGAADIWHRAYGYRPHSFRRSHLQHR